MTHPENPSPKPPYKKIKLECSPTPSSEIVHDTPRQSKATAAKAESLTGGDHCSICLHAFVDRSVIPTCAHEFCFECVLVWSEQSRRCPLCSQSMGGHLIHRIRSKYDYQKYYLTPLRTSPPPLQPLPPGRRSNGRRMVREREWGVRRLQDRREQTDQLDRAIARRRWIYEHDVYAKHVASNSYTRYRPYPTPAQFSASTELISRMTTFLRRELRVWVNLDVEFLTTFILSIMKSIDIRSESAVKLLAEFLDMDEPYVEGDRHVNAEHFAHEVYCYLRSPYRDLFVYDTVVQYDTLADVPPPPETQRSSRWRPSDSQSRSRSRSRLRPRSKSESWSPSGRRREKIDVGDMEREREESKPRRRITNAREEAERGGPGEFGRGDRRVRSDRRGRNRRVPERRRRSSSPPADREERGAGSSSIYHEPTLRLRDGNSGTKEKSWEGDAGQARRQGDYGNLKGKRQADIVDGRDGGQWAESAKLGKGESPNLGLKQVEEPRLSDPQNLTHNHKPRKPPRNQSLLQSVQAHLGTGGLERPNPQEGHTSADNSRNDARGPQLNVQHDQRPQASGSGTGGPPALLARLSPSDRQMAANLVSPKETQVRPSLSTGNNVARGQVTMTGMAAHEIVARTRAKLKEQDISLQTSIVNGSPEFLCERDISRADALADVAASPVVLVSKEHVWPRSEPGHSALHHDASAAGNGKGLGPPVISCSVLEPSHRAPDLHKKLLNKLEEEKRSSDSRREADSDVAIPTVSSSIPGPVGIGPSGGSQGSVDSQALEAKLRMRAQLRVRLAAEKRGSLAIISAGMGAGEGTVAVDE